MSSAHASMPTRDGADPRGPGQLVGLRVGGAEHGDEPEEREDADLAEPAVPVRPAAAGVAPGREDRDGADGEQPPLAGERRRATRPSTAATPNAANAAALTDPGARGPGRGQPQRADAVHVGAADAVGVVVGVVDAHLQGERDAERERGAAEVERAQLGGGAAADEDRGGGGGQRARSSALHPVAGSGHVSFLSSCRGRRAAWRPDGRSCPARARGSEPVTTRWRGACGRAEAVGRRRRGPARASGAVPGRGTTTATTTCPHSSSGTPDDDDLADPGRFEHGLDRVRRDLGAAADQDVVGAAEHRQRAVGPGPEVGRAHPAPARPRARTARRRGRPVGVAVARGPGRPAGCDRRRRSGRRPRRAGRRRTRSRRTSRTCRRW